MEGGWICEINILAFLPMSVLFTAMRFSILEHVATRFAFGASPSVELVEVVRV
jgi:hypothetical protein